MSTSNSVRLREHNVLPPLTEELVSGHPHRYYALGEYVVVQPGVCGGRPTIKHTRIDARWLVGLWAGGLEPHEIARGYGIAPEAVQEAIALREQYDYEQSYA